MPSREVLALLLSEPMSFDKALRFRLPLLLRMLRGVAEPLAVPILSLSYDFSSKYWRLVPSRMVW